MSKPDSSEKPGPLAVDLDGTLAQPLEPFHISKVGDPYPAMLQRVKDEIASGRKVSIFTARAAGDDVSKIDPVRNWLEKHGLPRDMEITAVKDPKFAEFWDDRARQAKDGDLAEKMAAMVVRKKRIEEHLDEHCPHCDTKFVEKGGPRLEGDMSSGEYDWVCRKCNGIVEYPEMSDEYIDNYTGFGGENMKDILRTQRDKRRQYLARRSSEGARNNAQQGGGEKQAYREGPSSRVQHGDDSYAVDDLISTAGDSELVDISDLEWLLAGTNPDPARVDRANPDVPGIMVEQDKRKIVLDGLHRLAKAKAVGRT